MKKKGKILYFMIAKEMSISLTDLYLSAACFNGGVGNLPVKLEMASSRVETHCGHHS